MAAANHVEYCKYGLRRMATTGLWIHPVRIFQVIVAFVVSGLSAYGMSLSGATFSPATSLVVLTSNPW